MMIAERDPAVSERYGTFRDTEDGKVELHAAMDEERWRLQKHIKWLGRVKLLLAVGVSVALMGIMMLSQHQASMALAKPSPEVPDVASSSTSNTVSVQTVRVFSLDEGGVRVEIGDDTGLAGAAPDAWATFNDSLPLIGWSQLWVKTADLTKAEYEDKIHATKRRKQIMYAAGYAEGALTHHRIDQHFNNVFLTFFPNGNEAEKNTVKALHAFFRENLDWMYEQIRRHEEFPDLPDASYWQAMSSILAQFEGLVAGYHATSQSATPASLLDLFLLNADGDMEDLVAVVTRQANGGVDGATSFAKAPSTDFYTFIKNLKCSALIRILPDFSGLVWGHATWDVFASMNRIFKHYDVPLPGGDAHSTAVKRRISMSSSPGFLSSVDDWYMTSAGLGVLETTHGIFNTSLYDLVTPKSVPCWLRSKIANFLAVDGPSWTSTFAKYNSGTYNNQWMVVDTNKFVKGTGFGPHGLTILEQLPGFVQVEDVSHVINEQGYWASYNIPYFPEIYQRSGFEQASAASGNSPSWDHEKCARAQIFRRDAPTITSLDDMKRVMRSNNWRTDPLSQGHASHAVASRYDLETDPSYFSLDGAIDAKVTNLAKIQRLECDAQAGPTHANNPVFEWSPAMSALSPHAGQPQRFNFDFETMTH